MMHAYHITSEPDGAITGKHQELKGIQASEIENSEFLKHCQKFDSRLQ
jgi:hypothetical protein